MTQAIKQQLDAVVAIAAAAGAEILDVYAGEIKVETKGDGSPVTVADRRAHDLIRDRLHDLAPDIPLLSEESDADAFSQRRSWRRFWLVDPLDGTKEFIKRSDQFTVNIALIDGHRPVLGVVYAPVGGVAYFAADGAGAFKSDGDGDAALINVRKFDAKKVTMVASRSHSSKAVDDYRAALAAAVGEVAVTALGSSLKICLVADGAADIYPRLGPTSEWDTAAAHCVLTGAGGDLTTLAGETLRYNKAGVGNPWFLACGDRAFDWTAPAAGIVPPPHRRSNR